MAGGGILSGRRDGAVPLFPGAAPSASPVKTGAGRDQSRPFGKGFDFLGFMFRRQYRVARKRAIEKFKEKVRLLTPRQTHHTIAEVVAELSPVIRGWGNYFKHGHMKTRFEALDQWIRMRIRSCWLKRKAHRSQVASDVLPNRRLADLGLVSLLTL